MANPSHTPSIPHRAIPSPTPDPLLFGREDGEDASPSGKAPSPVPSTAPSPVPSLGEYLRIFRGNEILARHWRGERLRSLGLEDGEA